MSDTQRPEVKAFLERFFTPPNQLRQDSKPEIRIWVERITRAESLPSVLPCWRTGKEVDWYGLAFNDRQMSVLGESLTAFVGPSYTSFRGQSARLDTTDPIDQAVHDLTEGRAYKFRGVDPAEIWRALERMRKVWERRGSRERATPAPVGRVLRDFYMALHGGDAAAAEDRLTHLREHYHLDGVNLLYLRIQMLAVFRRWTELLALPELPDVLRLRRPAAVTEAILRAAYHTFLARFESPPDAKGAVRVFREDVLGWFRAIFASRAGMHSPEAAKLFMLLAVSTDPPDLVIRDELLARTDLRSEDLDYLSSLAAIAGPVVAPVSGGVPMVRATEAAQQNDFDRAFALARSAPPSPARARLLCECAFELGTLEARATALSAVDALNDAEKSTFLARRIHQRIWEVLQADDIHQPTEETQSEEVPLDWCSWLDHLDRHEGRRGSREIARRAASEWSIADFLNQPPTVERFSTQLRGARTQVAEHALRDCLPYLLTFFEQDTAWPNPTLRDVYRQLLDLLFFSTEGGRADLTVWNELFDAVLTLGVATPADYSELVTYLLELWSKFAAPVTLDWAIDALGLLAVHPCADAAARRSFLVALLERATGFARHIAPEQRELLRLLAIDLTEADLIDQYLPTQPAAQMLAEDPFAALQTKSITVYTLTENVGRQCKTILETKVPNIRVSLCHDRVATHRLKQLARQSDVFVLVSGSAKHAATDCIDVNRPTGKPILRPRGKGAASILAAIREYCDIKGSD